MSKSTKYFGVRLIVVTVLGLLILTGYFVITSYRSHISNEEEGLLRELSAIAATGSIQIDGDEHEKLMNTYREKDAITSIDQDPGYHKLYKQLKQIQELNQVESDIYTLVLETKGTDTMFYFGVSTGENPYYRHGYIRYPEELKTGYSQGGKLSYYLVDHYGTWLSSFAPIKNSKGEIVAVLHVDKRFDDFISDARGEAVTELIISLIVFVVLTVIMLYLIRKIILEDESNKIALKRAYQQVESQNKSITDSINYAQNIQRSIVPDELVFQESFREAFVFWRPKDIVSGDFPWLFKKKDHIYVAAIDCTGHGVPGAMMSFVGYILLDEINSVPECLPPGQVLDQLHKSVVDKLQKNTKFGSHDGMDVALCRINIPKKEVEFAGANRPLYYMQNNELKVIKGNRKPIGGRSYKREEESFTTHDLKLEADDSIFLFSDGLQDQFGGPEVREKKYSPRRIRAMIEENHGKSMTDIGKNFEADFDNWKGSRKQIDDVLLLGIKF